MSKLSFALLCGALFGVAADNIVAQHASAAGQKLAAAHTAGVQSEAQNGLVQTYCVVCHNDQAKRGGLTLARFDPAHPDQNADVAEKMIRKLRLGMMPPPGARRPDP